MHVIRFALIALVAAAVVARAASAQEIPGTYRLTICSVPCEDADPTQVVARGTFVLFASTSAVETIPDSVRTRLRRESAWLVYDRPPNACFSIPEHEAEVDGRELYAGIIENGLTAWNAQDGLLRVALYQSPDAGYTLEGEVSGGRYTGEGRQFICCMDAPPPETHFLAEKIGPADANACTAG